MWIVFCVDINSFLPLHLALGRPRTQEDLIPDSSGWWCQDCQDLWTVCTAATMPGAQIQSIPQKIQVDSYLCQLLFTYFELTTFDIYQLKLISALQTANGKLSIFYCLVRHKRLPAMCLMSHVRLESPGLLAPQTQWHWSLVTRPGPIPHRQSGSHPRQWEGSLHHFPDCLALWGQTQPDDSHSFTTWMFNTVQSEEES